MALKANQGTLKDDVEDLFRILKSEDKANTLEKNRGRIENRTCEVIRDFDQLENREKWAGLKSITKISSIVEVGEKKSTETRLYISSLESSVEDLKQYIRQHWGIENSLHWTLDVTFNEDRQRKRSGNATENFAQAQKIALNLLKKENSTKLSVKAKRLKAAWDNNFLLKIINF